MQNTLIPIYMPKTNDVPALVTFKNSSLFIKLMPDFFGTVNLADVVANHLYLVIHTHTGLVTLYFILSFNVDVAVF